MDKDDNSKRREPGDDLENGPVWPRRPEQPLPPSVRPRLDPPRESTDARSGYRAAPLPRREPSLPPAPDDPKETRALPLIEPSRFDRGNQPRPTPVRVPPPPQPNRTPGPAQQPPRQAQPQPQPRPVAAPEQEAARKPGGGWQYERDEEDYGGRASGYAPNTPEAYAPSSARSKRSKDIAGGYVAPTPGNSRNYLSVNVEEGHRRNPVSWLMWLVLCLVAVAVVGILAITLAWQGQYSGKVYAGVSVLGVDLGGKTPDAAKKMLNEKVQSFVSQPITLTWRGKEWKPSAEQLGIKVDVNSSVDEAYGVGRGGDFLGNASQEVYAAQSGYVVPFVVQISEPTLQAYLAALGQNEIDQKLFEGDVRLNGSEVVAMAGKEGRSLRVYDALAAIRETVAKLEPGGKIDLPVDVVQPTVSAEEVQPIQGLLAIRVSAPITATLPGVGGKPLTLDRDALVRFTTIERNPDRNASKHIELGWKDYELKILADKWAKDASRPAQNARFAWNNGAVSVLSESADGYETDANTIVKAIKEHADVSDKREFELPGKVITPTVSSKDMGALGIKEQMGSGTSTFKGSSAERATNIRVAANLINGAVVPPGATFSFLQTIGGIDERHGFVEGYVIAAERTQRGVGGGVCQVSTTVFRAAFWSGLQVTERNQHSYRVGWYEANGEPVGFDAAVFDPGVDLKFVNDTQSYILLAANVSPDTLTVSFYGTKRPGEVKLEGPVVSNRVSAPPDVYQVDTRLPAGTKKQVETAHGGLDTLITRRMVAPGQPDKIDKFHSSYKAWPNWYIVASASQIPGGVQAPPNPTPNP